MARTRVGLRDQGQEVGPDPVGDVELPTVDDPAVAVAHRPGRDPGDVRPGVGLGDRDRADLLAGDRGPEVALAQVVAAELAECRGAHVRLHGDRHRQPAAAAPGQLLDEDEAGGEVAARAAPALGEVEAEEAELAAAAEDVVREETGVLPLVDVRSKLLVDEATDGVAQLVVLLGVDRVAAQGPHSGVSRPRPGRRTPVDCVL